MHYTRTGPTQAPTILLVHGYTCDHSDWSQQIVSLAQHFDVIAVDLLGHGKSAPPNGTNKEPTIEGYANDIADFIRSLDKKLHAFIGHSMGCRIGIDFAANNPELLANLVLIDGSQSATAETLPIIEEVSRSAEASEQFSAQIKTMFEHMFTASENANHREAIIQRALAMPSPIAKPLAINLLRWDALQCDKQLAALGRHDINCQVIQSTKPNAEGGRDSLSAGESSEWIDKIRQRKPDARVDIIENSGHFPMLYKPEDINTALLGFLSG